MVTRAEVLAELLRSLKDQQYTFVAVTPETHAQVLAQGRTGVPSMRDIFGWNVPFDADDISPALMGLLQAADAVERSGGELRSKVRVASLGSDLLLHSSYPTEAEDSVFFGPDTYRFARFLEKELPRLDAPAWLVDMGTGSGAGTIAAARVRSFARATMVDINPAALELAAVNAAVAGVPAETMAAGDVPRGSDLVIANPPYMIDSGARSYRDGGDLLGGRVALDWVRQALSVMAPGGTMLLYTGVAYVDGHAPFVDALESACAEAGAGLTREEIDPDVFGEELSRPQYRGVERIAAIGAAIMTRAA